MAGKVALALALTLAPAWAMDNGLARSPPMGWSSWNGYGGPTTPDIIKATADALDKLGLRALGYTHVVS